MSASRIRSARSTGSSPPHGVAPWLFRACLGAALAALVVLLLSVWPAEQREETWVYRIDTTDAEGNWDVLAWGVASGPRREGVVQTHRRSCRREAPTHTCRSTVEAEFTDRAGARSHVRTRCLNYLESRGRLPRGMASC